MIGSWEVPEITCEEVKSSADKMGKRSVGIDQWVTQQLLCLGEEWWALPHSTVEQSGANGKHTR